MARNQIFFGHNYFKIFIYFKILSSLNLSFFNFNFSQLIESNFIHIKNVFYNYKKKQESLNFFYQKKIIK